MCRQIVHTVQACIQISVLTNSKLHSGPYLYHIQHHLDRFKALFMDFAFSERASNSEKLDNEMATLNQMLGI